MKFLIRQTFLYDFGDAAASSSSTLPSGATSLNPRHPPKTKSRKPKSMRRFVYQPEGMQHCRLRRNMSDAQHVRVPLCGRRDEEEKMVRFLGVFRFALNLYLILLRLLLAFL